MNDPEFRNLLETVRDKTDIITVIAERITLDRRNKALCPFHDEKTPSFSVNPQGQYFHCFGCGVGGDVFKFLELYENKSFMEALSELAAQAGISLPNLTPEERQDIENSRIIEDILTEAAGFYHRSLTSEVRDYLSKKRRITDETISRYQIGYASGDLRKHLLDDRKMPLDLCLKAGVLKQQDSGAIKDHFYNRVIFPILKRGRVVFLTGRRLDAGEPKYLHLPGQIRFLYNEDTLSGENAFIVEGIPDCLSAVQLGYPAVAILGSFNFKPEYLSKFSRCKTIYICLDGDEAGKVGATKIAEICGERAKIIELPQGYDLNDYFNGYSKTDFDKLIGTSKDIIKYRITNIAPGADKTELPGLLDPVFKKLAYLDKAKAEPYLKYEIKPRFGLTNSDIDAYRVSVNNYRKQDEQEIKSSNSDSNIIYTASFDGLVDLVEHNGDPAFLIKKNNELEILSEFEKNGIKYVPPPLDQIPWLLPRGEEILNLYELQHVLSQRESDGALYEDLMAYHKAISELPGEEYYDLIVAWDFHTYLLETVQYSPIICLFAVPERGKSRTGKGMIHIAHRGIHVESLRDAYLVRVANDLKACLFFDVKDIWRKAEKNGSEDILLHRFEKGAKVPRVLYPEKGAHKDIVYYSIFGPTIIGTNEGVHKILETRAISINMPETGKRFENDVTPELSLPLKERLIAFRARHLGEILPDMPKPAPGRLGDILKPLHQIIRLVKPEREPSFLRLIKELQSERLVEKADSLEARILEVICMSESEVVTSKLTVKTITDKFNEGRSEKEKVNSRTIGRRLKAMGFKKVRMGDGSMAITWDNILIDRLRETYGMKNTPETSETPELLPLNDFATEVSPEEPESHQRKLRG